MLINVRQGGQPLDMFHVKQCAAAKWRGIGNRRKQSIPMRKFPAEWTRRRYILSKCSHLGHCNGTGRDAGENCLGFRLFHVKQ